MKQSTRNWAAAVLLCAGTVAVSAASATTYSAILTGPKESPSNTSPGIGAAAVTFDTATHVLELGTAFAGLLGDSTAAHIHCCTTTAGSGVADVVLPIANSFPLGVQTGAYSHRYDTSMAATWAPSFLSAYGGSTANAEAALLAGLDSGSAYFNIHSTAYPDGEIRGFLAPTTPVPEPASLAMLGIGLPAVLMAVRRRRKPT